MQRRTGELWERARAAATAALGCALLAGAIVVQGCGQKSGSGRQAALAAPAAETPASAPAVTPAEAVKPMVASPGALEAGAVGALPPDLKITVADTLVTPGEPVAIVVRGTADVSRLELKDDFGVVLPFTRDADGRTWRVSYRVPLRPSHERWGVSVTAHNESDRWRRVWVFLHARYGEGEETVVPDTTRRPTK